MQPKIHRHVLCAKNVIEYFKNIKPGGCFAPPPAILLGGKTTPLFYILGSSVKTLLPHKTCLYSFSMVLGCIAYLFNRGVDASQVNLLIKKGPVSTFSARTLSIVSIYPSSLFVIYLNLGNDFP